MLPDQAPVLPWRRAPRGSVRPGRMPGWHRSAGGSRGRPTCGNRRCPGPAVPGTIARVTPDPGVRRSIQPWIPPASSPRGGATTGSCAGCRNPSRRRSCAEQGRPRHARRTRDLVQAASPRPTAPAKPATPNPRASRHTGTRPRGRPLTRRNRRGSQPQVRRDGDAAGLAIHSRGRAAATVSPSRCAPSAFMNGGGCAASFRWKRLRRGALPPCGAAACLRCGAASLRRATTPYRRLRGRRRRARAASSRCAWPPAESTQ